MSTAEQEYDAWTLQSAERLRGGQTAGLDLVRMAEKLGDMGRSERHALSSHLKAPVLHLLKWRYQPGLRGLSWKLSITDAHDEIEEILEASPSLRGALPELVARRHPIARCRSALETGLPEETLPSECPFPVAHLLDEDSWTRPPLEPTPSRSHYAPTRHTA